MTAIMLPATTGASRPPQPDDRGRAPRAADRHRARPVRRARLRGHLGRGDRRPRRRSPSRSSTSTSAARRACTPSWSTARCAQLLDMMRTALTAGQPASLLEQAAFALLDYIEQRPTASGSWSATPPSAPPSGSFVSIIGDIADPGRVHPRRGVQGPRLRPRQAPMYAQMLVGMVGTPASGGSTPASPPRRWWPRTWSTWPGTACAGLEQRRPAPSAAPEPGAPPRKTRGTAARRRTPTGRYAAVEPAVERLGTLLSAPARQSLQGRAGCRSH